MLPTPGGMGIGVEASESVHWPRRMRSGFGINASARGGSWHETTRAQRGASNTAIILISSALKAVNSVQREHGRTTVRSNAWMAQLVRAQVSYFHMTVLGRVILRS